MDIFKIVAVGVVSTAIITMLKQIKPELSLLLSVAASIIILIMIINELSEVIMSFNIIAEKTGLNGGLFSAIIKIIGVGYITEFASGICGDAGSKSVGDKILLGGKIIIMILALPIVTSLIDIIVKILP
jgi:stage III sporulation protein AD